MSVPNINHVVLTGRDSNGIADDSTGTLHGIAADEEESLDITDQEAIAAAAAAG
jgi:hypothetical protein